jgi:uncharacterized RDD family membrane protein YckC
VEYEDRVRIATPEGVDLELTLAGVGSRFSSAIIDFLLQMALLIALLVAFVVSGGLGGWGGALFALLAFLLFAGYDVLFEVFASGRTPGKRMNGIRVVRVDGSPVRFLTSAVRNILRLIDMQAFYLVGIVCILVTSRNQRLGDLAAGTLIVRERLGDSRPNAPVPAPPAPAPATAPGGDWQTWDVGGVTAEEIIAVRSFLARRGELTLEARKQLAAELAAGLRQKVPGMAEDVPPEVFLAGLVAAKEQRGRA